MEWKTRLDLGGVLTPLSPPPPVFPLLSFETATQLSTSNLLARDVISRSLGHRHRQQKYGGNSVASIELALSAFNTIRHVWCSYKCPKMHIYVCHRNTVVVCWMYDCNRLTALLCEKMNVLIHRWRKDYHTNLWLWYHRIFAITKWWDRQLHFDFLVAL